MRNMSLGKHRNVNVEGQHVSQSETGGIFFYYEPKIYEWDTALNGNWCPTNDNSKERGSYGGDTARQLRFMDFLILW